MSALIGLADSAGGLLYGLAIKGDFKRHQVALDSSNQKPSPALNGHKM
jgi:hypothetical protein